MTFVEKVIKASEKINERTYCECGCKNREDYNHGASGYWNFKNLIERASIGELRQLAKFFKENQ